MTINKIFHLSIAELENYIWETCDRDFWNLRKVARYSRYQTNTKKLMERLRITGPVYNKNSRLLKKDNIGLYFIIHRWDNDWKKRYVLEFVCMGRSSIQLSFDLNTGKIYEIETYWYAYLKSSLNKNKSMLWYLNEDKKSGMHVLKRS